MEKNNFTTAQLSDLMIKVERAYQYSGLAKEEEDPNKTAVKCVAFLNEMLGEFYKFPEFYNKNHKDSITFISRYAYRVISVFYALNNISESAADTWLLMVNNCYNLLDLYNKYQKASSTDGGWFFKPSSKESAEFDLGKLYRESIRKEKRFSRKALLDIVDFYNQYLGKDHTYDEVHAKYIEKLADVTITFEGIDLSRDDVRYLITNSYYVNKVSGRTITNIDLGKLYYIGALYELEKLKEKNNSLL